MPQTRAIAETRPGAPGRASRAGGLTMLDAAALVTGGAVASVHFRDFDEEIAGLGLLGWALLVPAFAWLALTAAGPFVFLVRRFSRRPDGYPGPYDWLWLGFGLPWVVAALVRSGLGGLPDGTGAIYSAFLYIALAAATIPALARLWRSLPRIEPMAGVGGLPPSPPKPTSWTGRIGRAIAVLWPLQFGLGLVVTK
ncbi:MAG TPA: hypothetical protein VGH33_12425 [Isosphaeraceae bacterium]